MSAARVEIVREAVAAANSGDWSGLFRRVHTDIECRDRMHAPDVPEVLTGIAELQQLVARWERPTSR
jgi:hypothetical protein